MSNDLHAQVEVIAMTKRAAELLVKRVFFHGDGWKVTNVYQITPP
jgi:hypothetical protein